jgi:hypothetical protein
VDQILGFKPDPNSVCWKKKDPTCMDENAATCSSASARGVSDFKESFRYDDVCSTCPTQPSDCAEWIRNISPNGCFHACASGLLGETIQDYYVMYTCTDQEKALVAKTLNLGETWYKKVGDNGGVCTADSAGKENIGDVRGRVTSRQECMDLCTERSECIGITSGTAIDCELEARDCDALVEQGLPAGFTASCEQTCRENCVVRGNDGRGGDYKCWKKMPEKDTEDEESTSLGIAKTAYASVGVVLATVGSSVLLLCCSHM